VNNVHNKKEVCQSDRLTFAPYINGCCIICASENEFWRPIISTTNISYIRFALYKRFCTPKIAQFQLLCFRIHQKILRFDVSMTYPKSVDVGQSTRQLVEIQFHI
jgi:hypothetical protein